MNSILLKEKTNEFREFIQKSFFKENSFEEYYIIQEHNTQNADYVFEPYRTPLSVSSIEKELKEFFTTNKLLPLEIEFVLKEILKDLYVYQDELLEIKLNKTDKKLEFLTHVNLSNFYDILCEVIEYINEEIENLNVSNTEELKNNESPNLINKQNKALNKIDTSEENNPIKWFGTDTQIVYLINQLIEKNFLSVGLDIHATINKHFVDSNNKPFSNLKQAKYNIQNNKSGKPKRGDELDNIIDNLPK